MSDRAELAQEIRSGIVKDDEGLLIAEPGLKRDRFVQSATGRRAELTDDRPPYAWYRISRFSVRETDMAALVLFIDGQLDRLELGMSDYPQWDPAGEAARHRAWLRSLLGEACPYTFKWGIIDAQADYKGGSGPIVIRYRRRAWHDVLRHLVRGRWP